ncbi:PA14 domain-containing protein [Peribacillus tepidiphilus]|uniref:PA14 domain-containing protein n=1 Tax=Peribacillus tepidiphilus TaxID=2652445 RepID=UPI0035B53A3E
MNRLTDPDPVPTNKWLAAYYPNVHLTGTPVKQEINQINFAWGNASPNKNIPADNFSAIYQRKYVLNKAGTYILSGVADDGIRVYVNGVKQIDFWTDRIHYFHKELSLPAGTHHIKVEYYERNANSRIELNFEDASSAVPFEKWRASYYPTMNFQGTPIRQIVNQIDYVWETNSPATAVPNDHFSAIFEKRTIINNPGSYILSGNADDGIRIYIDGVKLVDLWTKGAKPFNEEVNLSTGIHHIKVEYYDQTGNAQLKVHLAVKGKNSRVIYSDYDITLNEAIDKQLNVSSTKPQTDKKYKVYVRSDGIELDPKNLSEGKAIKLYNVRGGPGTNYWSLGVLNLNEKVTILNTVKAEDGFDWYEVSFNRQWVNAAKSDVAYYMDPSNFKPGTASFYQFLKLSQFNGLNAAEVNEKILKGKGILEGRAQSFIQAGFLYNINEIYLIAHALLEKGNGKSELASGVKVKKKIDREGKYVVNENGEFEIEILESDSKDFDAIVYNMYGIGAYDNCPLQCGARTAFNKGWFTPNQAIIGGAQFVADRYIYKGQDTLYKMRWNPTQPATHQYATDIGWAIKQTPRIYDLYNLLDNYNIDFDVPRYK